MRDVTNKNFGLLIAYMLPGLMALWRADHFSPTPRIWLAASPSELPTVGGFLYVTLESVAGIGPRHQHTTDELLALALIGADAESPLAPAVGFSVELVGGAPLVQHPIMGCFDLRSNRAT